MIVGMNPIKRLNNYTDHIEHSSYLKPTHTNDSGTFELIPSSVNPNRFLYRCQRICKHDDWQLRKFFISPNREKLTTDGLK